MKTCFKCQVSKPLSEFYRHPQMADGHLNKCKSCTRGDSVSHREAKITDPDWIEKERERCRLKAERQRSDGTATQPADAVRKKWREANIHKVRAQTAALEALKAGKLTPADVCENCSTPGSGSLEMHHHDYTRPLAVVWLCVACHKVLHRKHRSVPVKRRPH